MAGKLERRVAVITGASRGLGEAMARALAAEGASVALVSRDRDLLHRVSADIRAAGGRAEPFAADVASEEQVRRVEQEVLERFGTVNILINNAGVVMRSPIGEISLEDWRRVMDTNVTSAFLMCRSLIP
ncbi:MAG TPA: SDR family NAD(P)-dependent oxidoreductase, partial [Bryobacteraceae bacterium]|nr:SDR family NAD(P)-dependent oxidoreductase [Bryobacteraceae bacterium]